MATIVITRTVPPIKIATAPSVQLKPMVIACPSPMSAKINTSASIAMMGIPAISRLIAGTITAITLLTLVQMFLQAAPIQVKDGTVQEIPAKITMIVGLTIAVLGKPAQSTLLIAIIQLFNTIVKGTLVVRVMIATLSIV